LSGEPWRNGGACAGTVRTAGLSRTHGGTTSGLFSDVPPLEASEYALAVAEGSQESKGALRRQAAEALQRSQRQAQSGESWRNGGACAGTMRTAGLSRTHGGTTSGLFSDFQPLEGSESAAAQNRKESTVAEDEGKLRRQAAQAKQQSQRHALTGEPWRNGGACAGTVRTACLSRTHGGTTSGLFSDFKPLEASEAAAAIQEIQNASFGRKQKSKDSGLSRGPWKNGGACAGSVRAPGLSRTHGGTTSGLFSDVQPLAGSESAVNLLEKRGHSRSFARKGSCPDLRLSQASTRSGSTGYPTSKEASCDFEHASRSESESSKADEELELPLPIQIEKPWRAEVKDVADLTKPCCGSAFATVRAAHCGGA
jgi:hypothetical protein